MRIAVSRLGPAIAGLAMPSRAVFVWWLATGVRTACQDAVGRPIAAGEPGCTAPLAYVVTHPPGGGSSITSSGRSS